MENYGSDKPDLRFDMKLLDFNSYIQNSDFNTFKDIINNGGIVKGIICPNAENYSRKVIDELTDSMKTYYGAKGLAWFKVNGNKFDGGIGRFFNEKTQQKIIDKHNISDNQMVYAMDGRMGPNDLNFDQRIGFNNVETSSNDVRTSLT